MVGGQANPYRRRNILNILNTPLGMRESLSP